MPGYAPELGQLMHGQPHQAFDVPLIMEASLSYISDRLSSVMWNINQAQYESPFSNSGNEFKNDVFEAAAYSWGDEAQTYNFAWKDLRISWYKRAGRGMSANIEITPGLAAECLEACIASLDRMDDEAERVLTEIEDERP